MEKSNELNESLKRYKELLGYNTKTGGNFLTERNHAPYLDPEQRTDYADGDEEEETDDTEFDFGDDAEGGDNKEGGEDNADFDFGDDTEGGDTEDEGGFGDTEGDTEETDDDEFGTADEFSAADDIESDDDSDTEEIDVTDIVKRADDAKGSAERAVTAAEEGKNMIKDLMAQFKNFETSLSKIDSVSNEINSIKQDLQSQKPKEKLELRSLDSYPFNVKLTDYWDDVAKKSNYEVTDGNTPDGQSPDGQVKVWKLDPNGEDVKDFSSIDIKKSFVPEGKSSVKKKL
jgi:hypothetical protein